MTDRPTGLRRSTLAALVAAALIGGAVPVWAAVLSQPTGIIEGRAPTATGSVSILMPGGTATLVDNAQVLGSKKPNEFTLAPLSSGVTFTDLDGDVKATPGLAVAPAGVTWTWKGPTGTPLTAAQLNQTFAQNFAHNATLTLQATVPVLSTALTGSPTTSGTPTTFATPVYRVRVNNPPPPVIRVNGHTFAWNSPFPNNGYGGAKFVVWANGIDASQNSNYTYAYSQPWARPGTAPGEVHLVKPASGSGGQLVITVTSKANPSETFSRTTTLSRWYTLYMVMGTHPTGMYAWCKANGGPSATSPSTYSYTNAVWTPGPPTHASSAGWRNADGTFYGEYGAVDWVGNPSWGPMTTAQANGGPHRGINGITGTVLAAYTGGWSDWTYPVCEQPVSGL